MSAQTWVETIIASKVAGAAVVSTVTQTTLLPGAAKAIMRAHTMGIGKAFRVRAAGRMTNLNPTPGNITLDIEYGGTIIATSGAIPLLTSAGIGPKTWRLEWDLVVRAEGTAANVMHTGSFRSYSLNQGGGAPTAVGAPSVHIPYDAPPAVGGNFDGTVDGMFDLLAQWSVSSASNTITCEQYTLESLN